MFGRCFILNSPLQAVATFLLCSVRYLKLLLPSLPPPKLEITVGLQKDISKAWVPNSFHNFYLLDGDTHQASHDLNLQQAWD